MRADMFLVDKGLASSRQKAKELIETGSVTANGQLVKKPSQTIQSNAAITIDSPLTDWVSRGALKLLGGLEAFPHISLEGKIAVDLGASTGGFTQVLLRKGAQHVFAIDVGHGQMAPHLADDSRVTMHEKCNARDLSQHHITLPVDIIVCDVSFISLVLALPAAMDMALPGAHMIALIKPQFEVGRQGLDKGGIVKDDALRAGAVTKIQDFMESKNWQVLGTTASPVKGPDGNQEYLMAAVKR
ncbi:MAG: TlyA family RNA methyltransferase [Candidatus Puniceispirillaceae bacterium]